jgi:acyl transferase domain-containing protein/SAM-dependent methyltransferase
MNSTHLDSMSPVKRALYQLRATSARLEQVERAAREPIAIVGIGLRCPGAVDVDSFWRLLRNGVDAITTIPASRWDLERLYDADPDAPGKMYTRHGGFIDDVDRFDAAFFGISQREAQSMDPQQRILLEVAWEALEHADCDPKALAGSDTGVFVAMSNSDYSRLVFDDPASIDLYSSTGINYSVAAGRVSFLLGLRGPSLVVDTACSGSLVSVHLASQSLRTGECHLALAGGVNLILSPEVNINFSKARMMAPDGRCKTFDARADGYVRGEGCGVVVLKRLTDAVADGDRILAVIRGSAVNQDGRSSGLTVPNGPAQESVIRTALARAGLEPSTIDYVEAHGTGTPLGDPIEAHAVKAVFGPHRDGAPPLLVGSVKTNVGHLESAAGMAGLIKVALGLHHEWIPAHLHFEQLNPYIDWQGFDAEIPVRGRPWTRGARPRYAGVSSFGFSGTNAHVIVGEAPVASADPAPLPTRPVSVLTVSAATEGALHALSARYAAHLDSYPELPLEDICFTANAGRAALEFRAAYAGRDREALRKALAGGPVVRGRVQGAPGVAFLFTGQGAQYAGMGLQLYEVEPVFRNAIDECATILRDHVDVPLTDLLWGASTPQLEHETTYAQPALFALQCSLARLWRSWGVEPTVVVGHSVGEYAAACVAGVYPLAEGLKFIAARGRLTGALPRDVGAMSAIMAPRAFVDRAVAPLRSSVAIAACNGPESVTIAGDAEAVASIERECAVAGYRVERLRVSHAFHSPLMEPVEAALEREAAAISMRSPAMSFVSSVTGGVVTTAVAERSYWRRQLRDTVRFDAALVTLAAQGCGAFVEIGPGSTLLGIGQTLIGDESQVWIPSIRRSRTDAEQMAESLGAVWVRGVSVNWAAYESDRGSRRTSLPTYPFGGGRYWIDHPPSARATNDETVWSGIAEAASRQAMQGRLDLDVATYTNRWEWLDRLTTAFIIRTLSDCGLFRTPGECHTLDTVLTAGTIAPAHRKLIQRWIDRLVRRGDLKSIGERYECVHPLSVPPIDALIADAGRVFGADRIFLDYTLACGELLTAIVKGRTSPLETLFPGGEFSRAEALYEHAPLSSYFSSVARAALEAVVRGRGAAPLRVVEIGAGTGATTTSLVPVLPDGSVYDFTDVSDLFLHHGGRKFARWPAVRFARFDVETGAGDLTIDGTYDVVVATNVIHAVENLDAALDNVRRLLTPGGCLILCEVTSHLSWFDITTGLIEGWQRFEDRWRVDQPLLGPEQWAAALAAAGFDRSASWPDAASPASVLGQHVIVARAPGRWIGRAVDAPVVSPASSNVTPADFPARDSWLERLHEAPADRRHDLIVELVRRELAGALRASSPDDLEASRRFAELGVDSLMALEFRKRLTAALGLGASQLAATLVFDHPTVDRLAAHLGKNVLGFDNEPQTAPAQAAGGGRAAEIQNMSEEDAEAQLLNRLQAWQATS